MYPTKSDGLNREDDETVYFFTPAYFPFDNFSSHMVHIWDKHFQTSEHAFQWKKFSVVEPDIAEQIFSARSPEAVKRISDAHKAKRPVNWEEIKVGIMEDILRAKLAQHDDVREALERSGKKRIIENSPVDSYWGIGPDQNGKNMLGVLWMKIRNDL